MPVFCCCSQNKLLTKINNAVYGMFEVAKPGYMHVALSKDIVHTFSEIVILCFLVSLQPG